MTLCSRCKKERDSSEFQKGGRQLKTCAKCREKRSKVEVVVQRTGDGGHQNVVDGAAVRLGDGLHRGQ